MNLSYTRWGIKISKKILNEKNALVGFLNRCECDVADRMCAKYLVKCV